MIAKGDILGRRFRPTGLIGQDDIPEQSLSVVGIGKRFQQIRLDLGKGQDICRLVLAAIGLVQ